MRAVSPGVTLLAPKHPIPGATYPHPTKRLRRNLTMPRWHHQRAKNLQAARSMTRAPPVPHQTWNLNVGVDQDLTPDVSPNLTERSVASRAKCLLTAHMFQHPWLAIYPQSAQLTSSLSCSLASLSTSWTCRAEARIELTTHFDWTTRKSIRRVRLAF